MPVLLGSDLDLITVTGDGLMMMTDADAVGTVTVSLPRSIKALRDLASKVVIFPQTKAFPFGPDGSFSVALPATDDPDVNPTGFTYHWRVVAEGAANGPWEFDAALPLATPGGTIDIVELAPVQTSPGTGSGFVTQAQWTALLARLAADEDRIAALEALAGFGGIIDGGSL